MGNGGEAAERALDAVIFDLDGVITLTAHVHAAAWKLLFDGFLRDRATHCGTQPVPFVPFDPSADYLAYVDGRPRQDGVRTFLAARGIELPEGSPEDPAGAETVHGLSKLKDRYFREAIDRLGVKIDAGVTLVSALRARDVRVGVASSSRNCIPILRRAGLIHLFDAIVDGEDIARLELAGKPAADMFLECLRRLGLDDPTRAIVVEDAVAGVAAGRAGGFGLVIGIDRGGNRERLVEGGADWVVSGLAELTPECMDRRLREAARSGAGGPDKATPAESSSRSPRAPGRSDLSTPPR